MARRLAIAAGLLVLALVAASSAVAAPPSPRLKVLTNTETTLRSKGKLRVRVRFGTLGRVRVMVRVRGGSKRYGTRLMKARLLSFRRPGRRTVTLRLTRFGRSLLRKRARGCAARLRFVVLARARSYRRLPGRPLFSPHAKSRGSKWVKSVRRLTRPACGNAKPGASGGSGTGAGTGTAAGWNGILAGAAASDITPPVGTPMFAYTARSNIADPPTDLNKGLQILGDPVSDPGDGSYSTTFEPSEGIHTRVRARAIVIQQGDRKFAMVQTDLGGLPYALTQEVLKRVESTGITAERLLLSATHTHSSTGPIWPYDSVGYALLGGDVFQDKIFDLTAEGIAEAIRDANSRLEPARLGTGSSQLTDASRNREFDTFKLNPEAPSDDTAARAASIDPKVSVVRVDAADGRPLGVWSNFAVHPTSFGDGNLLFSGDNAATAERVVEADISREAAAAGHPPSPDRPVVNVWTNANEGDISPNGGPDKDGSDDLEYVPNDFASANMAGMRTGGGIVAAWRDAGSRMDANPTLAARRTLTTFSGVPTTYEGEPVGPEAVLGAGGITAPDNTCGPDVPGQGPKVFQAGGPLVPNTAPVSMWQIGPLGLLALPTEMTKTQGKRIRDVLLTDSGGRMSSIVIAGLTNSYLSYTATPEEYNGCTYEGSFTLFGRRQGPQYREVAKQVLAYLFGGPAPMSALEPPRADIGGTAPSVDQTPDAGNVVAQPAPTLHRYERATFKWKGGDPAVDPKRRQTFVALQREVTSGVFQTVGTEDGFNDTTKFDKAAGEWTETWQFAECDPLGSYRFRVTGIADKDGTGAKPYTVTSNTFTLQKTAPLISDAPAISGGSASFAARYPDPGPDILLALPRRVRTGTAKVTVNGNPVDAHLDAQKLRFTAPADPGDTVVVTDVDDGCGNTAP